jgi:hypothetical protein
MSTNAYFPTEEARKAKNWDMLQQYQEGRASVARLENEIKARLEGFAKVGRCSTDLRNNEFISNGFTLSILRPDVKNPSARNRIDEIPLAALDIGSLLVLSRELEQVRIDLRKLGQQMRDLGIPLPAVRTSSD